MKIFVAGATGALGTPVVRKLIERGHEVVGLTRSSAKADRLAEAGAQPVLGDVLDRQAVEDAVSETRPDALVQLLNALPKRGPIRPKEMDATNVLRVTGTDHLVDASLRHGVTRYVAESMIFGYGYGDRGAAEFTEEDRFPIDPPWPSLKPALDALGHLERRVLAASERGLEGIVLRMGLFYGPEVGSTEFMAKMLRRRMLPLPGGAPGVVSWIHIDDAAEAAVMAVESKISGEVFNVVDDEPTAFGDHIRAIARALGYPSPYKVPRFLASLAGRYAALMARTNLRVSNTKAKKELGWAPRYPSAQEGMRSLSSVATL